MFRSTSSRKATSILCDGRCASKRRNFVMLTRNQSLHLSTKSVASLSRAAATFVPPKQLRTVVGAWRRVCVRSVRLGSLPQSQLAFARSSRSGGRGRLSAINWGVAVNLNYLPCLKGGGGMMRSADAIGACLWGDAMKSAWFDKRPPTDASFT